MPHPARPHPGVSHEVPLYLIYRHPPGEVELDFIHFERISDRAYLHQGNVEPHRHRDLHQMMLWTEGSGRLLIEGAELPFAAPCLLAVPAGCVHGYRLSPQADAMVVTLSEDLLRHLTGPEDAELRDGLARPALFALRDATAHGLEAAFDSIAREYHWHAPARVAAIGAYLRLVLVAIARLRLEAGGSAPTGPDDLLILRFRAALEAGYTQALRVTDYARALGVTEARLNAACRLGHGRPVSQIIQSRRLLEAKRLLRYTVRNVAEIGFAVGFHDPAYFSRVFARATGIAPAQWRQLPESAVPRGKIQALSGEILLPTAQDTE